MSSEFRTLTISMAYNTPSVIKASVDQFYNTNAVQTRHLIVDQCWPLDREELEHVFKYIHQTYDCEILRPGKNLGLAKGFNYAFDQADWPDNGGVIGYDPDSYPVTPEWDKAMCEVFVADPTVGWISLWNEASDQELLVLPRGRTQELIAGHRVNVLSHPVMNSICMFRSSWLKSIGGLSEPNAYYGGLEAQLWPKLVQHKMRWLFMSDAKERAELRWQAPRAYLVWKDLHGRARTVRCDFETWLAKGCPEWPIAPGHPDTAERHMAVEQYARSRQIRPGSSP